MRKTHRAGFDPAIAGLTRSPKTRDRKPIITHNVIRYILHSSKRQEAFADIQAKQQEYLAEKASGNRLKIYSLVSDNITRWNSWYDAAVRALKVKQSINDFLKDELKPYYYTVSQS
jgi:hypothetical protein